MKKIVSQSLLAFMGATIAIISVFPAKANLSQTSTSPTQGQLTSQIPNTSSYPHEKLTLTAVPTFQNTINKSELPVNTAISNQSGGKGIIFEADSPLIAENVEPVHTEGVPLYVYLRPEDHNYFYTINFDELGDGKYGYVLEGVAAYVFSTQQSGTVPLYRYYRSEDSRHFYTINFDELGDGKYGYVLEGVAAYVFSTQQSGTVPLYRYYRSKDSKHFYTVNFDSFDALHANGYVLEGVAAYVFATAPLYRYYRSKDSSHFYTINFNELGNGKYGYVLEGVAAYVFSTQQSGTVPLYRYYRSEDSSHFYTINFNELGDGKYGYVLEGVAAYVFSTQQLGTVPLYRYYKSEDSSHFYTINFNELGKGKYGYVLEGVAAYVYIYDIVNYLLCDDDAVDCPAVQVGPSYKVPAIKIPIINNSSIR